MVSNVSLSNISLSNSIQCQPIKTRSFGIKNDKQNLSYAQVQYKNDEYVKNLETKYDIACRMIAVERQKNEQLQAQLDLNNSQNFDYMA